MADTRDDVDPDVASPLDQLLTQASTGFVQRLLPGMAGLRFVRGVAQHPQQLRARTGKLASEFGKIAVGSSEVAPGKRDRRFTDPAWADNPILKRILQGYLATTDAITGLVDDVPLDWQDGERVRFAADNVVDLIAPSNNPLINPLGWKAIVNTGGANLIRGPKHFIEDMSSPPRVPSMVDPKAYTVGKDLACTPGSVVLRTPVFELIQYKPQAAQVSDVPLVIVPPTINKYYILDLAPGRSLVEYLLQQGQQVFMVSWRNPDARHAKWGYDTYVSSILEALDTATEIAGTSSAHLLGTCSGGLLSSMAAAHLAESNEQSRLASLTLLVTMLDQSHGGMMTALVDQNVADLAVAQSRRKGYLDGSSLAEVFAWLRPNDLIWNYWVNNYIQGNDPPKFDILFWNADSTRMTAALHRDFVDTLMGNKLAHSGAITVLGTEIDLTSISVDSYVVAGVADHICPWPNCYRSSQLLGGKVHFVLSTHGHIAALVNPPSNPKASHQASDDNTLDAQEWRNEASTVKGSWWPELAEWLMVRADGKKPAPDRLGSAEHPVLEEAPGTYVLDR